MRSSSSLAALAALALLAACADGTAPDTGGLLARKAPVSLPLTPEVFADGLQYPRGFAWAPNGDMYVAEAGTGGTSSTTEAQCAQVVPPVGPYTNGPTSRISRIDRAGHVSAFATGFPSDLNQLGLVSGVADIAFVGNQMYALMSGGGCDHGSPGVPQGVARVSASGEWTMINDLGAFEMSHPTAVNQPGDFEPTGTWYSMIRSGGSLVAVEPNHGDLVRIDPRTGGIARLLDISVHEGHWVPTVIAERGGDFYISNLGTFPVVAGQEKVIRVSRSGDVSDVAGGFTTVLGLDFDHSGRMYVLENSSVSGDGPTPMTGRVIRIDKQGDRDVIVDGLFLPTAMRFGPDGMLYISNIGFGPPLPGQILRVAVPN
jgi:hypothetical protein